MTATLFRVILPVSDVERAARFYEEILGMPGRRVSPGRHYFDCDGPILACFDAAADGDDQDFAPNPEWLYFAVDDLEGTHTAAQRAGASFAEGELPGGPMGAVATRPWGERSFYARDPFGNGICFVARESVFTGS